MVFKCETFDKDGKIKDLKYFQVSAGGVEDASKDNRVQELRKRAMKMGYGFRVHREDN